MNTEPTTADKLRGLPWDIAQSAANSVFVQLTFFGSVFVLFLSELGLSKTAIGTLLSLLPFTGLAALFIAPAVARFGYKRTFLLFWGIRKMVTALLLLTPWVKSHWGLQFTLVYVAVIVTVFAVCRSVGMTARLPWVQEFVPDSVRGKFAALSNMFSQSTAFLSVLAAGYVLKRWTGLGGFVVLFGVGVLSGLISVWAASFVPGGAPAKESTTEHTSHLAFMETAKDSNFAVFLLGLACITLASGPLVSFLPLFMQEQVGLSAGSVVWLQNGTLLGGLLFSYLWGWLADRYGSKPVMMSGVSLQILLPVFWLLMPRHSAWSLHIALGIAFLQGLANIGWQIGSARLRFVSVIPPEKKRDYQALYFAWIGIVGGLGQLMGGWLLDLSEGISGQFLFITLDSYTILFLASLVLPIVAILLFRRVRADSTIGTGEFATMFFRGNPFMAMESMIRFHRARDERATVSMTERLGRTQSPLTVEELLEALSDPRFFVRFEAIAAIARRGPDDRLTDALVGVLMGDDPALSTVAAWALGRIGDERAIEPLRAGLVSRYRSVQAHCARSLGTLGDLKVAALLMDRIKSEADAGLQIAYASALGKLGVDEATDPLLKLLHSHEDELSRRELALALARIVGNEHHFIRLLRRAEMDLGTVSSQEISALNKALAELGMEGGDLATALDDCAEALARNDLGRGVELLIRIIQYSPLAGAGTSYVSILDECAARLNEFGESRIEYMLLALHTMTVGLARQHSSTFARVFG